MQHPTDLNTWRLDKKGLYDTTTGDQKADVKQKALGGESRVYCPPLCNDVQYEPSYVVQSQALSEHAANTIGPSFLVLDRNHVTCVRAAVARGVISIHVPLHWQPGT